MISIDFLVEYIVSQMYQFDEQKKLKLKKKEKKVHVFFWLLRVLVHQQQYHLQYHIHFYHEGF
jgi:hypothetical protein